MTHILFAQAHVVLAAKINGITGVLTFGVSLPGIFMRRDRKYLTVFCYLLIFNALFTLCIGLVIWFFTLETKRNLAPLFDDTTDFVQSMLQWRFQCCGYDDPTKFITDDVCSSAAVAAAKGTCKMPFATFANTFLDGVFTTMFGFCALDGFVLLSCLCVLKDRAETARYIQIDEKSKRTGILS